MANKVPKKFTVLAKGEFLYGNKTQPERLSGMGALYQEQGCLYDAIDFYEMAKDQDAASHLAELAKEEGNAFLLRRCLRVMGSTPSEAEWIALAQRAESQNRMADAAIFFEQGGQPLEAIRIREVTGIVLPSLEKLGAETLQVSDSGENESD